MPDPQDMSDGEYARAFFRLFGWLMGMRYVVYCLMMSMRSSPEELRRRFHEDPPTDRTWRRVYADIRAFHTELREQGKQPGPLDSVGPRVMGAVRGGEVGPDLGEDAS